MVDIRSKIASLKANVVKRLFENQSDTVWRECFNHYLNPFGGKLLFHCDYDVKCLGTAIPAYYLHVMECWKRFHSKEISDLTVQSFSSCIVRNNRHIRIDKKNIFWEDFYKAGLIYVGDLFDSKGSLKGFQYWVSKGVSPSRLFQWMSLIDAIPRNWISAIKGKDLASVKRNLKFDVTKICIDMNIISISSLYSKRIYTAIVGKKATSPVITSYLVEALEKQGATLEHLYLLAHKFKIDMKIREFYYKFVCNRLATGEWLYKVGIIRVSRVDWLGNLMTFFVIGFCSPFPY